MDILPIPQTSKTFSKPTNNYTRNFKDILQSNQQLQKETTKTFSGPTNKYKRSGTTDQLFDLPCT